MKSEMIKRARHARRVRRVRKHVTGTPERPRLAVSRSLQHIYAQVIDDLAGRTLCAVSTQCKELRVELKYGGNCAAAEAVGKVLGAKAKALGIEKVCFDRRGCRYHGRIAALAKGAREAGLQF
jgi:large subunit ribosomal protein L18